MNAWFDTVFTRTVGHEGNFQKHHKDRGNWTTGIVGKGRLRGTKYGISAMSYPDEDIENLSLDQAKMIYFTDWWMKMGMQQWPQAVTYQMFDAAINHGIHNANMMLQRALGVDDDGIVGPITLGRLESANINDLCFRFLAERLEFFAGLGAFADFGRGWCRRVAGNLRYAAEDTPNEPVVDQPHSSVAKQIPRPDLPQPQREDRRTDPPGRAGTERPAKGTGSKPFGHPRGSSKS